MTVLLHSDKTSTSFDRNNNLPKAGAVASIFGRVCAVTTISPERGLTLVTHNSTSPSLSLTVTIFGVMVNCGATQAKEEHIKYNIILLLLLLHIIMPD